MDISKQPRLTFNRKMLLAIKHGIRNVTKYLGRSFVIILTVGIGVALATAIIAAANGSNEQVRLLLHEKSLPAQINLDQIHDTLNQARDALTYMAYAFSGIFVGVVTWVSMEKRCYAIGTARIKGLNVYDLLIEYLVEAIILCTLGGLAGIGLGYELCQLIPHQFTLLPMHFRWEDVQRVFPQVSSFSFLIASLITIIFALRPNPNRPR
jgi:ABC-type antimicrobial peptide transport system permease subunit